MQNPVELLNLYLWTLIVDKWLEDAVCLALVGGLVGGIVWAIRWVRKNGLPT